MAWTTPPTYTTGQLITAAIANAQWRDNLNLLATYLETATGRWAGELKTFREEITSVAFSATPTFDLSLSNNFKLGALTANVTAITVSNWTASKDQTATITMVQDGTGGRSFAFPVGWHWSNGVAPSIASLGPNKRAKVVINSQDGGTTIDASLFVINA